MLHNSFYFCLQSFLIPVYIFFEIYVYFFNFCIHFYRRIPIKNIAVLALNPLPIGRLVTCEDEADRSKEDLEAAMQSALGSAMFANSTESELHAGYSKKVSDAVTDLINKEKISEGDIADFHRRACGFAVEVSGSDETESRLKRPVKIEMFGRSVQVEVLLFLKNKLFLISVYNFL